MSLHSLFKANRKFFIGFFLFVIICSCILLFYSKADGFLLLNPYHSHLTDFIFIYLTSVGDGLFCIGIGLTLLVFKKKFLGLMVLSSYAISGIIAQVFKYYILEARPAVLLKNTSYKYFIENVTLHNFHAFPSGHTASAFAMACVLSFASKNKRYSTAYLAGAIIVGYSRIYLAQHFTDDVLAGALIGFIAAIFCWIFFYKLFSTKLGSKKKLSNSGRG